ncbi:MAG: mannose-1-phosphate guanylyltransferase [Candidatus Bipolaricaulota bacterium]|nr:mannose-1-phosphate guanylyltransferase [Candidatus Bipolaricaulota bacterium]
MTPTAFAVIMAGGQGRRLWPLSTPARPKQFLKLIGEETMLQATLSRITSLVPLEDTLVVAGEKHNDLLLEQLPGLPRENLLLEPVGRGTAICVGLAALRISMLDPEAVMVVLPADHVILDDGRFLEVLRKAISLAKGEECLITLGITPTRPATGYGYIEAAGRPGLPALKVKRFVEKPDRNTAGHFWAAGDYFWNSGMFVWRAGTILHEIEINMPELHRGLMKIKAHFGRADEGEMIERVYHSQPVISIDYGVMERSDRVLVVPAGEIGWSDVGDWAALQGLLEKDEDGNVILARHVGEGSKNNTIVSEGGRLIATLGVENLVIVDAEQGLLVMDRARAQGVRGLASRLEADDYKEGNRDGQRGP